MSITLITGVPGSGKTLYCVSKLLQPIIGTQIPVDDDDGRTVMHTRTVYTNINGLQLDHELIDANGAWEWNKDSGDWDLDGSPGGLHDWHEWAKPGSFIVFDEFQKAWPPRPNGSRIPPDVQALDTHRHMGVDFVLLTQNCLNVDRHILGLVDRHLHVRRVANAAVAIVYEWDHASRSLLYKNAVNRSPWRYDKKAFQLYKSARVHTKQRRTIPGLVWFVLFGLILFMFMGPTLYARINAKMAPAAASGASAPRPSFSALPPVSAASGALPSSVPGSVPLPPASAASAAQVAGCVAAGPVCRCYDAAGHAVKVDADICQVETATDSGPSETAHRLASALELRSPSVMPPADLRMIESLHGLRATRVEWGRLSAPSY